MKNSCPFAAILVLLLVMPASAIENQAPRATITADSEYSGEWSAKNVADGQIPEAGGSADNGAAWAVRGDTHRDGASITFVWEVPVTVGHIVYFGRTAYGFKDCWAAYQVLVDDGAQPVAEGRLEAKHGPQRIALPAPRPVRRLTLRFTASHGGANPGASEIMVFPQSPSDAELAACMDPDHMLGRLGESLALLRRAEQNVLSEAELASAAERLADPDLFVQGVAEWAIATQVGRDNNSDVLVWPKAEPQTWYRQWSGISQERRAELEWVRQAVALGLYRDPVKLLASADDLLRRGKSLQGDTRLDAGRRAVTDKAVAGLTRLRQAMAEPGLDLTHLRALWIEARRALRPAVFAQADVAFDEVLFSTVFAAHNKPNVVGTHTSWTHKPGGDLCVLSGLSSGEMRLRPLLAGKLGQGHVQGLDLWFDGDRVVFAWARQEGWPRPKNCPVDTRWPHPDNANFQHELRAAHEPAHLYAIGTDGKGLRQLTDDPYWTDVEPTWLPDGGVAFTSDRCAHGVICDSFNNDLANLNLYAVSPAGKIRRLTNNKDIDRHPHLLDNGLIAYTRWEYQERHFFDIHSVWTVCPDGTMADAAFKQHLPRPMGLRDTRSVPQTGKLVSIATGHHTYAYGPVVLIDASSGMNSADAIRTVTPGSVEQEAPTPMTPVAEGGVSDAGGFYQTPCALSASCFLVSYAYPSRPDGLSGFKEGGVDSNGMGLYLIDVFGNKELVYRDPLLGVMYPVPLKKRPRPPILPDRTQASQPWATCSLSDVYYGMGPEVKRGTVKWLRVSEALPWPLDSRHGSYKWVWGPAWSENPGQTSWNPVRVIGLVPVEEDGSAHFKVPTLHAGSVYFQALDADYCEVRRMRSNISFQPGEVRSCYGCHESKGSSPNSAPGIAATKPAVTPEPPSWGADRALGFEWLIQPILDRNCIACHDGGDKRTRFDLRATRVMTAEKEMNQSYLSLLGGNICGDGRGNGKEAAVWLSNRFSSGEVSKPYEFGSSRSRLVQQLKKGHHEAKLTSDEWLRLITWIDANAPYHDRFIDKRPDDGGAPRREAEFRWPQPFSATTDEAWRRVSAR